MYLINHTECITRRFHTAFLQHERQECAVHGRTVLAPGRITRPATGSLIPGTWIRIDIGMKRKRREVTGNDLKKHLLHPGSLILPRTRFHLVRACRLDSALRQRAVHIDESAPYGRRSRDVRTASGSLPRTTKVKGNT